jgi:hypothetical protein
MKDGESPATRHEGQPRRDRHRVTELLTTLYKTRRLIPKGPAETLCARGPAGSAAWQAQ